MLATTVPVAAPKWYSANSREIEPAPTTQTRRGRCWDHAADAAAYAGPGRAVAGGVRWGVRGVCAGGVGAQPRRGLRFGRARRRRVGVRGAEGGVGGRMLAGRGRWASGCALLLRGRGEACGQRGRGWRAAPLARSLARSLSLARSFALSLSLSLPGLSGMVHLSDVHHWTKSVGYRRQPPP